MTEWLKTTIPGIIILGACGSLLAGAFIWGLKALIRKHAPKFYKAAGNIIANTIAIIIKPAVTAQVELFIQKDQNKLLAYYAAQGAKLFIFLFIETWLLFLVIIRSKIDKIPTDSNETILSIAALFLMLGLIVRQLACMYAPLVFNFQEMTATALKNFKQEHHIK